MTTIPASHLAPSTRRAGITLGFGMGGFVDGILLHQILEWHNMGSSVIPPTSMDGMRQNMIWDGEFHAVVWLITLVGIYLHVRDLPVYVPIYDWAFLLVAGVGFLLIGWAMARESRARATG